MAAWRIARGCWRPAWPAPNGWSSSRAWTASTTTPLAISSPTDSGRVCEVRNGRFVEAKLERASAGHRTALEKPDGQVRVGSASSPLKTAVVRTSLTGLGARRVGCTSPTGHSPGRVGAGPMTGRRRTPCVEAPGAIGGNRCNAAQAEPMFSPGAPGLGSAGNRKQDPACSDAREETLVGAPKSNLGRWLLREGLEIVKLEQQPRTLRACHNSPWHTGQRSLERP